MRMGETSREDFKVKRPVKKTACDGCGVSGLQCYYYRVAAVHQGANEADGDQRTQPSAHRSPPDNSIPLISVINVHPLFPSAPL